VTVPGPNLVLSAVEAQRRDHQSAIEAQAGHYPCPTCGAKAGVRCRFVTCGSVGPGYPTKTKVEVRQKPCRDRVALAIQTIAGG
jgi:hypothetical protein